jgi:hypothetical protein
MLLPTHREANVYELHREANVYELHRETTVYDMAMIPSPVGCTP